jgi:hypothetical protein
MDVSSRPVPAAALPEGRARAVLRRHPGDGLEVWLAGQPWRAAEDGSWLVEPDRARWTFRVEGVPGRAAVRVVAKAPESGAVTSWLIGR